MMVAVVVVVVVVVDGDVAFIGVELDSYSQ